MKKTVVVFILLCFGITGCATYDAKKDPVYQAYLQGEITYGEYVNHFHALMADRRQRALAFQNGMNQVASNLSSKKYTVRDEYGIKVGSITEN